MKNATTHIHRRSGHLLATVLLLALIPSGSLSCGGEMSSTRGVRESLPNDEDPATDRGLTFDGEEEPSAGAESNRVDEPEECNGSDDDQDGAIDEGCPCDPAVDMPRACYSGLPESLGRGPCKTGEQRCGTGASGEFTRWTMCDGEVAPAIETCGDGIDNDCSGAVDDHASCAADAPIASAKPQDTRPAWPNTTSQQSDAPPNDSNASSGMQGTPSPANDSNASSATNGAASSVGAPGCERYEGHFRGDLASNEKSVFNFIVASDCFISGGAWDYWYSLPLNGGVCRYGIVYPDDRVKVTPTYATVLGCPDTGAIINRREAEESGAVLMTGYYEIQGTMDESGQFEGDWLHGGIVSPTSGGFRGTASSDGHRVHVSYFNTLKRTSRVTLSR
jgi:hypothetical protein